MSDDAYQVGYGQPPKHTQFRSGQSGNPKGRPKQKDVASAQYSHLLDEPILVQQQGKKQKMSPKEISLRKILKKALEKSDVKSIAYLFEQFEKYDALQPPEKGLAGISIFFEKDGGKPVPFERAQKVPKKKK